MVCQCFSVLCLLCMYVYTGGNEYGQCGEEPERKEDGSKALRRDIAIPQRCAPKLSVRQVCEANYAYYIP